MKILITPSSLILPVYPKENVGSDAAVARPGVFPPSPISGLRLVPGGAAAGRGSWRRDGRGWARHSAAPRGPSTRRSAGRSGKRVGLVPCWPPPPWVSPFFLVKNSCAIEHENGAKKEEKKSRGCTGAAGLRGALLPCSRQECPHGECMRAPTGGWGRGFERWNLSAGAVPDNSVDGRVLEPATCVDSRRISHSSATFRSRSHQRGSCPERTSIDVRLLGTLVAICSTCLRSSRIGLGALRTSVVV